MEESMSKFMAESAKRHEENSNIIKEIRTSTDAEIRNQGTSIKTLEIQIGQMRKVMEESLSKFMAESAKRHEENSNIIKEIRTSTDAEIRNQGTSIKTLEIQIGQMRKVLQERRIKEDYHSINDDIPLVIVYTTGDVHVQGMLILDVFLTEEIHATDDFKDTKIKPESHKGHPKHVTDDDEEVEKEKKDEEVEKVKEDVEIKKEKDIAYNGMGSMEIRKE
nr:hypothetical protein [Tanacetum cinerariifolium]